MNKLFLSLPFILFTLNIFAQNHEFCGTTEDRSDWLRTYQKNPDAYEKNGSNKIWVPLQFHIAQTEAGYSAFTKDHAMRAFCRLKNEFSETNIELYLAREINIICNSALYQHYAPGAEGMMREINLDFPNVINVYFTKKAAGYCGYAYSAFDYIVVDTDCADSGHYTLVHEMGHVFSLPHTFSGNTLNRNTDFTQNTPEFYERVDGSNCSEAGDGFCDTPPDYLGFRWKCLQSGLSEILQHDPIGQSFRSDAYYYMSYGDDDYSGGFSPHQMDAMSAYLIDQRPYLIKDGIPFKEIISSDMGETTPPMDGILKLNKPHQLLWEPLPNASHYIVELSTDEQFFSTIWEENVSENSVDLNLKLDPNHDYYWRVSAYNLGYPCPVSFPINHFKTDNSNYPPNDSEEISTLSEFQISPNPFLNTDGTVISINSTKIQQSSIYIYNMLGQQLFSSKKQLGINCVNEFDFDFSNFSAGVYYFLLETETEKLIRTIVIK